MEKETMHLELRFALFRGLKLINRMKFFLVKII